MTTFLHKRVHIGPDEHIVVEHSAPCNIMLLDNSNYVFYRNGQNFHYYGGYFDESPSELWPPHAGHWNVVADLGGARGRLKANVEVVE